MSGPRLGRLAISAALLLSALLLLAGPVPAHATVEPGVLVAAETQPGSDDPDAAFGGGIRGNAPENDRDRRVLAALIFTVVGTIGLITIGSVVLLTQPGDRQVMVVVEPAEAPATPSAEAPQESVSEGGPGDGKKPAAKRRVP